MAHMVSSWAPLHNPLVQLVLSIPVYLMGLWYFGKSGYQSLKTGIPNMDVLIFTGAAAALFYSIFGTYMHYGTHEVHQYLFFETGASIITFVLAGNVLEKRSVKQTTKSLETLSNMQVKEALLWENKDTLKLTPVEQIRKGDFVQVNSGMQIPFDGVVEEGSGMADEQLLSGETLPITKLVGHTVSAGTLLNEGNLKIRVIANVKDSTLSKIIEMVKKAQANRPSIQKLGDRVSAVFVPVVMLISLATFLFTYFVLDLGSAQSMLRAVAVLVISCPCAMGLATPTAIMVGIGKAAKRGIIIKGGDILEKFAGVEKIIFDKTGTLTTGEFNIPAEPSILHGEADLVKGLIFELEKFSMHPIAQSVLRTKPQWNAHGRIQILQAKEEKGAGVEAIWENKQVKLGSKSWCAPQSLLEADLFLTVDGEIWATLTIEDELKTGGIGLIDYLKNNQIDCEILSGDKHEKVKRVADELGIQSFAYGKLPQEKLEKLDTEIAKGNVAMVGDGINDAPALSKVPVGISFSKASDIAVQASGIVVTRTDLKAVAEAHQIAVLTYRTIKQNLFWAFFYNVICIPLAAAGFLHPMLGALSMAFSDVIVIGNSIRLGFRKLQ